MRFFTTFSTLVCCNFLPLALDAKGYEEVEDKNTLKVLTPSLSSRTISKFRLENGLSVYAVSDKDAPKSAAALAVSVGSWSDPAEYPGMAHFLEHMLFMGTKAYPDENTFMQYVSDHGGSTNAFTASDRTVYSFTINNDSFSKGLDIFSHFFIDPLFQTSGVQRELHAVDQEHAKNIRTDGRRKWMIFKETGNQQHPNKAFGTGNAETLGHIPREALVAWDEQNYLACRMYLVIYSNLSSQEIKDLVVKDFSDVPTAKTASSYEFAPLSSQMQKAHITYIKPVKDLKILSLDWELPKQFAVDKESGSAELIAYTLQNGSENSLIEDLKRNHLAESLSCGVSDIAKENKFLDLTISLTKLGVEQIDTVIGKCFQAINGLKKSGIPRYIFQEMQTMEKITYEYQGREDAFDFVTDAASDLVEEPLETFPQKTSMPTAYNLQNITAILDFLTPQNCIYYVLASPDLTDVAPNKVEKWNGGEYAIKKVSDEYLKEWSASKPDKKIALPAPNPYIPQNLMLLHKEAKAYETPIPALISQTEFGKNYVFEDTFYLIPEISYKLGIKSPSITGTSSSQAHLDLLVKTFSQKLSPLLSVAEAAGLSASLGTSDLKLQLNISGYSEKAPEFLSHLLLGLKNLSCTEEEYRIYQDLLLSEYENVQKAQPYIQGAEILSSILYNDAPLASQKALALKNITYQDFNQFLSKLFSICYVEGLYTGNLTKKEAEVLCDKVKAVLAFKGYPLHEQKEKQLLILPKEDGPYMISEQINALGNSAFLVIEEGPFSYDKKAAQVVLGKTLSESFFDNLRSKQQTGYIAASWPKEVENQLLQFFVVQSATHEPEDLISRYEIFLENFIKDFSVEFPEDRFKSITQSQIDLLKKPLPNLAELSAYLYLLAFTRDGQFDYNQMLITSLQNLSYSSLKKDARLFFSRKNTQRLAVLVKGDIPGDKRFQYHKITTDALRRLGTYISSD